MDVAGVLSTVMMVTVMSWDTMVMASPILQQNVHLDDVKLLVKLVSSDELHGLSASGLDHKRIRRVTKRNIGEEEQEQRWKWDFQEILKKQDKRSL